MTSFVGVVSSFHMDTTSAQLFNLKGKVAVVTGGAGMLGGEFMSILQGAGAIAVSIDMRLPTDATRKGVVANITQKGEVINAFDAIEKEHGTPTILINAAGRDIRPDADIRETGPFEDYPEESWDAVIDSHLKGALFVSQEFIRRNKKEKLGGSIVNISSHYGVVSPDQSVYEYRRQGGEPFYKPVAYSVAKSGMLNFTRWLAEYGAPLGIRVNTLVPGGVENKQDEVFMAEYAKRTMLRRMAQKNEYNGAVLFLVSDASSYMTGSTLIVDGGWTAK